MKRFACVFFALTVLTISLSLPSIGAVEKKSYQQSMKEALDEWKSLTAKDNSDVIAIDMYLGNNQVHKLNFDLDSAVYSVQALSDPRCTDLRITIYDSGGVVLAKTLGGDSYPYCEFLIDAKQNVRIEIKSAKFAAGAKEAYVNYLLECMGTTDDQSRQSYVNKHLESLRNFVKADKAEIVDSSTGTLSQKESRMTFTYDLEPGTYLCTALGGLLMPDIDLAIYDESGALLTQDTENNSHPVCIFTLSNEQTVSIAIAVVSFRGTSPSEYFCWCLSRGDVYKSTAQK